MCDAWERRAARAPARARHRRRRWRARARGRLGFGSRGGACGCACALPAARTRALLARCLLFPLRAQARPGAPGRAAWEARAEARQSARQGWGAHGRRKRTRGRGHMPARVRVGGAYAYGARTDRRGRAPGCSPVPGRAYTARVQVRRADGRAVEWIVKSPPALDARWSGPSAKSLPSSAPLGAFNLRLPQARACAAAALAPLRACVSPRRACLRGGFASPPKAATRRERR